LTTIVNSFGHKFIVSVNDNVTSLALENLQFITGVNDTSDKFNAGVNDTNHKLMTSVNETGDKTLDSNISAIF